MAEAVAWLVVGALCIVGACGVAEYGCYAKSKAMRLPGDYGPMQGCMVQADGKWVPLESYRVLADP